MRAATPVSGGSSTHTTATLMHAATTTIAMPMPSARLLARGLAGDGRLGDDDEDRPPAAAEQDGHGRVRASM